MGTLTLTAAELVELTHKQRPGAQERALRFMGIEHRRRPDGSVAVLRAHIVAVLGPVIEPAKEVEEFQLGNSD